MVDLTGQATAPVRSRLIRPPRSRRRAAGGAAVALVVLGVAWIVVTGLLALGDVDRLRGDLKALESDFATGHEGAAKSTMQSMQAEAAAAHARTTGPAWWLAAQIPGLGQPLATARDAAALLHGVTQGPLPAVARAAQALDPAQLRTGADSIDLRQLSRAAPLLTSAADSLQPWAARAQTLPSGGWLSAVKSRRDVLATGLDRLHGAMAGLGRATRLLPGPLGAHGVQRYFVAFINEAEARGVGGVPGSFALLTADDGQLRLSHFASDDELIGTRAHVDLGKEFNRFYGEDSSFDPETDIRDSDRSPDFPDAAKIWMSMWQAKFHQQLDGAIAVDTAALGYLLGAVGPVTLADGTELNSSDAVKFFESAIYKAFAHDTAGRKAYQNLAARAIASHVFAAPGRDLEAMARALQRAASQRRVLVYSSDRAVESAIANLPVSGTLPVTTRPFLDVVVNDVGGTKLDYYLDRTVTYTRRSCAAGPATVTITLRNAAPSSGLPPYVVAKGAPYAPPVAGEADTLVSLYSTAGAHVNSGRLNGGAAYISADSERGHPVTTTEIDLKPGQKATLTYAVHEPLATGHMTALTQPLVRPLGQHVIAPAACGVRP